MSILVSYVHYLTRALLNPFTQSSLHKPGVFASNGKRSHVSFKNIDSCTKHGCSKNRCSIITSVSLTLYASICFFLSVCRSYLGCVITVTTRFTILYLQGANSILGEPRKGCFEFSSCWFNPNIGDDTRAICDRVDLSWTTLSAVWGQCETYSTVYQFHGNIEGK